MAEKTFTEQFRYRHRDNPYHHRLAEFSNIVMRDHEAEEFKGRWNESIFKRQAPLYVEIGSGYGHFMLDFCGQNPGVNFVGLDFRFKRTFNLVKRLARSGLGNFRYLRARGERIDFQFGQNEVDRIFYFFPDPWPKKRHHKKRLFQTAFLEKAYAVLRPGGRMFVKTDHEGLSQWILDILEENVLFSKELVTFDLRREHPDHFLSRFTTKFERIFVDQEKAIKGFELKSTKGVSP